MAWLPPALARVSLMRATVGGLVITAVMPGSPVIIPKRARMRTAECRSFATPAPIVSGQGRVDKACAMQSLLLKLDQLPESDLAIFFCPEEVSSRRHATQVQRKAFRSIELRTLQHFAHRI